MVFYELFCRHVARQQDPLVQSLFFSTDFDLCGLSHSAHVRIDSRDLAQILNKLYHLLPPQSHLKYRTPQKIVNKPGSVILLGLHEEND